jgi:hypothetical protein
MAANTSTVAAAARTAKRLVRRTDLWRNDGPRTNQMKKQLQHINETEGTLFQITDDNRIVYSLRQEGWFKGKPRMTNAIAITIEARDFSPAEMARIASIIKDTMNKEIFGI